MTLRTTFKSTVQALLHHAGVDLVRHLPPTDPLSRRARLFHRYGVDTLFDIGANAGQFAMTTRSLGYSGAIVSFEPLSSAFSALAKHSARDPMWLAINCAIGGIGGTQTLHVAGNSQSSSLLNMLPAHVDADPSSAYVRDESVEVITLASALNRFARANASIFIKIDSQGSEHELISPLRPILDKRIIGFQLELSLVALYDGTILIEDVLHMLRAEHFQPVLLIPHFYDPRSDLLLQADGLFIRSDLL